MFSVSINPRIVIGGPGGRGNAEQEFREQGRVGVPKKREALRNGASERQAEATAVFAVH